MQDEQLLFDITCFLQKFFKIISSVWGFFVLIAFKAKEH